MTLIIILQKIKYRLFFISVSFHHVLVKKGGKHKWSTALGLLANQFGRPVGRTHVIFQTILPGVLLSTAKLLTEEGFLFLMNKLDVGQQVLLSSKVFRTKATIERLPLQVNSINMSIQFALLSKHLIATIFFTWEWPLPQMNCVYMRNQVYLSTFVQTSYRNHPRCKRRASSSNELDQHVRSSSPFVQISAGNHHLCMRMVFS